MDQHPQEWWDVSTDQNSTIRVDTATKDAILNRMRDVASAGVGLIDPLIEVQTVNGNPCGIDVRRIDAWAISTPESRERNRVMSDALDDELDEHDRVHQRGKYKPKQWTPEDDEP